MSNDSELPPEVREYLRIKGERLGKEHGARGGNTTKERLSPEQRQANASKAGKASTAKLTPEQRSERARQAAAARWGKEKEPET